MDTNECQPQLAAVVESWMLRHDLISEMFVSDLMPLPGPGDPRSFVATIDTQLNRS